jgi:hypothetical protein
MQKGPAKRHEIIIIGTGAIAESVTYQLAKTGSKPFRVEDTSLVHFIGNNLFVLGGEKIGFKRALLLLPETTRLPDIKGLEKTNFRPLGEYDTTAKGGYHVVVGSGPDSLLEVVTLSKQASKVDIIYDQELLKGYDMSVQDVVRRHLKSIGVSEISHHLPIAATTKNSKTLLLLRDGKSGRQISCDELHIERITSEHSSIGLENQGYFASSTESGLRAGILRLDQNSALNLSQIKQICSILVSGRGGVPEKFSMQSSIIEEAHLFTYGYAEQDIINTHLGYRKSIARNSEKLHTFQGFIKVLTSMRGQILSISGILPADYDTTRLAIATRSSHTIEQLLNMFDAGDMLREELLEISREIG